MLQRWQLWVQHPMLGPWGSGSVRIPGQGLGEHPLACVWGSLGVPVPGDRKVMLGAFSLGGQGLAEP